VALRECHPGAAGLTTLVIAKWESTKERTLTKVDLTSASGKPIQNQCSAKGFTVFTLPESALIFVCDLMTTSQLSMTEAPPPHSLGQASEEPVPLNGSYEVESLQSSLKAGVVAQCIVAFAATVGLIYLLKLVLVTALISALLAFALDPLVHTLQRARIPRAVGAGIAVTLLLAICVALTVFFYNRALEFAEELPKFSASMRDDIRRIEAQAEKFENTTKTIIPEEKGRKPVPVEVQEAPGLTKIISSGASQFGDLALATSFIPFLVYFMLTWKSHVHSATLHIFPKEKRLAAYRTIGRISEMVRSFIVGNLIVGVLCAIASAAVFWWVGLPYFYFLGPISAFVGLVPYLGVFFALLAPLAAGMGVLAKSKLLLVFGTVIVLHLLSMNVLYPKLIGQRMRLNPLAVALSLLFWAWIWGAPGLILAIPLMAATKIVCDYVEPLQAVGAWLGD
jgi:predicted PurR-regulated permease PerM